MPKYVAITNLLSVDELASRYRKAVDPIEGSHFQIVWLLAHGKRVREVVAVTAYCANWIRILARHYKADKNRQEAFKQDLPEQVKQI